MSGSPVMPGGVRQVPARGRQQRGAAAVELALLLAPLVLIVLGVFEAGRALMTVHSLQHAVRDAARHLSTQPLGDDVAAAQAQCLAVHGNLDCAGMPRVDGLTQGMVVVCDALRCPDTHALQASGQGVVDLVGVAIEGYRWHSVGGLVMPALSLRGIESVMRGGS
jgi:Flp pilus assembly protein TadG